MDDRFLIAALFVLMLLGCLIWHVHENDQIRRQWQGKLDTQSVNWLSRFAWWRTWQLLFVLFVTVIVISMYGWQLGEMHDSLIETQSKLAQLLATPPAVSMVTPAVVTPNPTRVITSPTPPQIQPVIAKLSVRDVYEPEKLTDSEQAAMDVIKKRYEDILIIYFFMRKCGRIDPAADYPIIMSALAQDMATINAPGRMQNDILTAAQGSYNEIYKQNSCEAQGVDTLLAQYSHYIETIAKEYSAPQ